MKYDLEYFIAKFEAIPEDKWTVGVYQDNEGRRCAYGHCGMETLLFISDIAEARHLSMIAPNINHINDNTKDKYSQFGSTPKERVVNYLKSLRK